MTTPAYTQLASNKPAGSDSPTTFANDTLANVRALRDHAITGRVAGFVQTRTTGTGPDASRPQFITWLNSSLQVGFRMKSTWGGTGNWQQTSVEWEWTNDNGSSWTTMGTAQANTFDNLNNITASTNSGGFFTLVMEIWTKALKAVSDLAAHIAATAADQAPVHGLGTISTQAANNVAITGGTINGASVGATTPAAGTFTDLADAAGNVRDIPQNAKTSGYTLIISDAGKHISITTGGVTVPASVFSAGDAVTIYNNSGSNQTITQGASTTLRSAGTANTGNRTLAQYGICTVLCVASNTFVISGAGLS